LDESQKEIFANFLQEFCDVFSENIVVGNCDVVMKLMSKIFLLSRFLVAFHCICERWWKKLLKKSLERGVIEESKNSWSSPAILAKKKDGTIKFCVDYRKLNALTKKDFFPLPRMRSSTSYQVTFGSLP